MSDGVIYNKDKASQSIVMGGEIVADNFIIWEKIRRRRGITPTDIDAFMEYGGETFMFFEIKEDGKLMEYGQEQAYLRLIRALKKGGLESMFVFAWHNQPVENEIELSTCKVKFIYNGIGFNLIDVWELNKTVLDYIILWESNQDAKGIKI